MSLAFSNKCTLISVFCSLHTCEIKTSPCVNSVYISMHASVNIICVFAFITLSFLFTIKPLFRHKNQYTSTCWSLLLTNTRVLDERPSGPQCTVVSPIAELSVAVINTQMDDLHNERTTKCLTRRASAIGVILLHSCSMQDHQVITFFKSFRRAIQWCNIDFIVRWCEFQWKIFNESKNPENSGLLLFLKYRTFLYFCSYKESRNLWKMDQL